MQYDELGADEIAHAREQEARHGRREAMRRVDAFIDGVPDEADAEEVAMSDYGIKTSDGADDLADRLTNIDEEMTTLQDDLDVLRARMQEAVENADPAAYADATADHANIANLLATAAAQAAEVAFRLGQLPGDVGPAPAKSAGPLSLAIPVADGIEGCGIDAEDGAKLSGIGLVEDNLGFAS
ncbi:MAG: hypothetical protein M3Q10_08255 [Chloroflexota bacterium]|nr:hypothetical protein [Chloroflexota bacterium]